jgi:hypothetical protein
MTTMLDCDATYVGTNLCKIYQPTYVHWYLPTLSTYQIYMVVCKLVGRIDLIPTKSRFNYIV